MLKTKGKRNMKIPNANCMPVSKTVVFLMK